LRSGKVTQAVEHLLFKCEALYHQKRKKKKKKGKPWICGWVIWESATI
jgi:hypothetical protein